MPRHAQPDYERRCGQPPIPDNIDSLLSAEQRMVLSQIESFGWELAFVRHPLFQETTVVVTRRMDGSYASLSQQGELEFSPDLEIRH